MHALLDVLTLHSAHDREIESEQTAHSIVISISQILIARKW